MTTSTHFNNGYIFITNILMTLNTSSSPARFDLTLSIYQEVTYTTQFCLFYEVIIQIVYFLYFIKQKV